MTPREEAISNAVQDAIKIWKDKYDKAMARAMDAESKLLDIESQQEFVLDYEAQLRDQFAIAAMNGIIAGYVTTETAGLHYLKIAEDAFTMADTMMSERKK